MLTKKSSYDKEECEILNLNDWAATRWEKGSRGGKSKLTGRDFYEVVDSPKGSLSKN